MTKERNYVLRGTTIEEAKEALEVIKKLVYKWPKRTTYYRHAYLSFDNDEECENDVTYCGGGSYEFGGKEELDKAVAKASRYIEKGKWTRFYFSGHIKNQV